MWAISNNKEKIRHIWGSRGDANAETLHTLCGKEEGKPPLDYLQFTLEKCQRCEAEMGKRKKRKK